MSEEMAKKMGDDARELAAGDCCPECLRPCYTGTFYSARLLAPEQLMGLPGWFEQKEHLAVYRCECGLAAATRFAGGILGVPLRIEFVWLQ